MLIWLLFKTEAPLPLLDPCALNKFNTGLFRSIRGVDLTLSCKKKWSAGGSEIFCLFLENIIVFWLGLS